MTAILIRLFLKNGDPSVPGARFRYGLLAGGAGLSANLLLFLGKLTAGLLSSSIAITADAFNNLSDAGSSLVTLVGFRLSSAPPDKEHPFGHGRIEYLTAMAVAVLILIAGLELVKSSVGKILSPEAASFGTVSTVILAASIAVKLWMAVFYRKIGRIIDSSALKAAAADSRNDVICTAVVLGSSVTAWLTGWNLDGYIGLAVAVFVLWAGISMIRETSSPLLGQAPDPQLAGDIRDTILSHDGILGIHDLMVHNYGPGRYIISLHAEVSSEVSAMRSHDLIDCVERELNRKYNAMACIHMDPVDTDNPRVTALKALVTGILAGIDDCVGIHDFRIVPGETHTNLIFDLVVPFEYLNGRRASGIVDELQRLVWAHDAQLFVVANIEHSYT